MCPLAYIDWHMTTFIPGNGKCFRLSITTVTVVLEWRYTGVVRERRPDWPWTGRRLGGTPASCRWDVKYCLWKGTQTSCGRRARDVVDWKVMATRATGSLNMRKQNINQKYNISHLCLFSKELLFVRGIVPDLTAKSVVTELPIRVSEHCWSLFLRRSHLWLCKITSSGIADVCIFLISTLHQSLWLYLESIINKCVAIWLCHSWNDMIFPMYCLFYL